MSTTLELRALRIQEGDEDAAAAFDRIADLEGEPADDATWGDMVALARSSVGAPVEVEEDRKWGEVKASREGTLVSVQHHGEWVDIYYEAGAGSPDDEFSALLNRLRDAGLTVLQGHDMVPLGPEVTVSEMVAAQNAEQEM